MMSEFKLNSTSRGVLCLKASAAWAVISASSTPPPMVPATRPSAEKMAAAPGTCGLEPRVLKIVARASGFFSGDTSNSWV